MMINGFEPLGGWIYDGPTDTYYIRFIGLEAHDKSGARSITSYVGRVPTIGLEDHLRSDGCLHYKSLWQSLPPDERRAMAGPDPSGEALLTNRIVLIGWAPGLMGDGWIDKKRDEKAISVNNYILHGQVIYPRIENTRRWTKWLEDNPGAEEAPAVGPRGGKPKLILHQDWQNGLGPDGDAQRAELARRAWDATKSMIKP